MAITIKEEENIVKIMLDGDSVMTPEKASNFFIELAYEDNLRLLTLIHTCLAAGVSLSPQKQHSAMWEAVEGLHKVLLALKKDPRAPHALRVLSRDELLEKARKLEDLMCKWKNDGHIDLIKDIDPEAVGCEFEDRVEGVCVALYHLCQKDEAKRKNFATWLYGMWNYKAEKEGTTPETWS